PGHFRQWVSTDYCPGPYRANLSVIGPQRLSAWHGSGVVVRAENVSIEPWTFTTGSTGGIRLRYTLTDSTAAQLVRADVGHFARTVRPGEHVDLVCGLSPLAPGGYTLNADLTDAQPIELLSTDFVQYGSEPLAAPLVVA